MRTVATVLVVLLVGASGLPAGAVTAADQQAEGYAGTHVSFETSNSAIVDYTVDGETMLQSMAVQSQSSAESQGEVSAGLSLSAVTELAGSSLGLDSKTEVDAEVTAESGASMQAHDNAQGILVVRTGDESQYLTANVSSSARAESESDQRVVVTTEDGTEGAFLVVGDGEVTVNDNGNVSAEVGSDGKLVFRSYPDSRDSEDQQEERSISEGKAAGEVYVMQTGEQGGELATDVVQYSEDTAVEVTETSEGAVTITAERSQEEGKILLTSVSEQAISSTEDLEVTVDGEAAARASSYSELESATDGGDSSKFLVRQQSSAEASADVLVAVNHFSTREITMTEGDGGNENGTADDETSTGLPGFGVGVALLALLSVALYAYRRP